MSDRRIHMTRRNTLRGGGGLALAMMLPVPALAYSAAKAKKLIDDVVADILKIINSGKSEATMLHDFEKIFEKYADVSVIGQLVLGADGRSASASQKRAFAEAFKKYMSRKYGRRFREFIGGRVEVQDAKPIKSFYEVRTITHMPGVAPFEVVYVVADKNGRFIDMKIEGISLVKSERSEIGVMLDKRGGDLNAVIAYLNTL